jgi:hypothetical protein
MRFTDRNFAAGVVVLGSLAMVHQLQFVYTLNAKYYNLDDSEKI